MTIEVGLIGYGYWGPNLLRNYMESPGAHVKWVCDTVGEKLDRACLRYPSVKPTADFQDLLDDDELDAVIIATPISSHHALGMAALEAGKHAFVEKPLAASTHEAVDLVNMAESMHRTLMVGHTFVFSPPVRKVKQLLEQGELGEVNFITSDRVNLGLHQKDVSVIWDLAPHDLSILYYWLNEGACFVEATGRGCITPDNADVAFVRLEFPSGVVASVDVSWLSPVKLRRTVVVGTRKMLLYDDTESVEKVKLYDHGVTYKDPQSFGEFQMAYRTGDIVSPKLETTEPLAAEAAHFIECIHTGAKPITDGLAGLQVVQALEAAELAMATGVRQAVPGLPQVIDLVV
jgi:predicted dehydrogenase